MQPAPTPSFFLLFKCHQGSRSCGSPDRGKEDGQVRSSQPHACLHSSCNRDIWSLWAMNRGIPEGVGSAVCSSFWGWEVYHLPLSKAVCGSSEKELDVSAGYHWPAVLSRLFKVTVSSAKHCLWPLTNDVAPLHYYIIVLFTTQLPVKQKP